LQLSRRELFLLAQSHCFLPQKQSILLQKQAFLKKSQLFFFALGLKVLILHFFNSFFNETKQKFIYKKFAPLAARAVLCGHFCYFLLQNASFYEIYIIFPAKHGNSKHYFYTFFIRPLMAKNKNALKKFIT
jgi:hypothetical protein